MADVPIDCDFPVWGLLPKKETGVHSFLTKYPEYDGRNTVIAILDSGVDPAAEGLTVTSTGEAKVIERFDCSGCGDVETTTIIKTLTDGCITGLTGRKLAIPETWKNPTGEWRVGILYPFSLYPLKLKERVQEYRREHLWDIGHKSAFAQANKELQDFESEHASNTNLTAEEKQLKEELEARVEVLQTAEKKYTDLGPTYDCVLFHDGDVWRACIDTSETGDLASGPCLSEYGRTRAHAKLTSVDEMTVSINVHGDGDTLEVVGMCSTHGTHVASIAAGYFPNEPERNGVAPGAKLVSLTIGDSRLGSMETGAALVRACIKIMELSKNYPIDVVNMSYGEHAHWPAGRVGAEMSRVVRCYGTSWVVSGGNHGPALGTVGAPPDIAQPILLGVGAYVSRDMMSAAYSLRAKAPAQAFSWSSRGPAADGAAGISIAAPGAAVAPVARFTLRNTQLMNGTSMAAPHVAGAIGILISGLKARGVPYSPFWIQRAIENSATHMGHVEPWAQGAGLLDVEKAFSLLTTYPDEPERDVWFGLQCGSNNAKGIFLRPRPGEPAKDVPVTVEPHFFEDHRDELGAQTRARQLAFSLRLALVSRASWVSAPAHAQLSNAPRPLSVRLDLPALPPGAHHATVDAYDVRCPDKGPLFRIPITVLQPVPLPASMTLEGHGEPFPAAALKRIVVHPPLEATWAVLTLSADDVDSAARFLVHAMQLVPRQSCRTHETQKMVNVCCDATAQITFPVLGGVTLEVVLARYWAAVGSSRITWSLALRGLGPLEARGRVVMGWDAPRLLHLSALRREEAQPGALLKFAEPILRPADSKISSLTARDVIPPGRQIYQLLNTYNFTLVKGTEVSPMVTSLCETLYESEFESQMWMLYNSCKQLMAVGDAYPSKYSVKLEKGEYVIRVCVRHETRSQLERLSEMPLALQLRLPQPQPLEWCAHHHHALLQGKKMQPTVVAQGDLLPVFLAPLPADKVSRSSLTAGAMLTGTVWFAREEAARRADARPLALLPPEPRRQAKDAPQRSPGVNENGHRDALRDFQISWLAKLEGEKREALYEELCENFGGAAVHVAYLLAVDPPSDAARLPHVDKAPDVTVEWCEKIIEIADKVIKSIDQEKLLAYLGMKNDTRTDASKIKQEQEKQRSQLIEALCRKGTALCRLAALRREERKPALADNMADLLKFTDLTDAKVLSYGVWHSFTLGSYARGLRLLSRMLEERPAKEVECRAAEAQRKLGWGHWATHTERQLPIKYPAAYRNF